jgi:peptidyl-tRNA hydrolase, PTH1 family
LRYLIAGLGNIGDEYRNTRHNVGYFALDSIAKKHDLIFELKRYCFYAEKRIKGRFFYYIKPTTFMNNSGKAVRYWMKKLEIPPENIMVILDDIALPPGKIRIRAKGGDGGHNGLTSIIYEIASDNFARLRVGIGNEFAKGRQSDYVLSEWSSEELEILEGRANSIAEAVEYFAFEGINRAMTKYNK